MHGQNSDFDVSKQVGKCTFAQLNSGAAARSLSIGPLWNKKSMAKSVLRVVTYFSFLYNMYSLRENFSAEAHVGLGRPWHLLLFDIDKNFH